MLESRRTTLRLFKECIAHINNLKYSDKGYLRERVREEFRHVFDSQDVVRQHDKARAFLQRGRFV